jgi:predicted RNA polymerase sigma factor
MERKGTATFLAQWCPLNDCPFRSTHSGRPPRHSGDDWLKAAAEDALSEAFLAALTSWPLDGLPQQPAAWLLTTARHRLIDQARHEHVRAANAFTLRLLREKSDEAASVDPFPDERLKLLFVCAYRAIDPGVHTPLMLQSVLGLDGVHIARAFLVSPATMGQRLVRAKAKIRDGGIAFEVPEERTLPQRLDAVLDAIYAAYGSGWQDAAGADPRSRGLADEASWLAHVLRQRMPEEPEMRGLLALTLGAQTARAAAMAEVHGPAAGLARLDEIELEAVTPYQPY